jgi:tRNA (uracil-5-)-methyltransferase
MLPLMVDHVVDAAVAPNSAGDKMTHLIDCYCGSGLFCLSSASHFDVCVGIEVNEKAVEEATRNAEINNVSEVGCCNIEY